MNLSHDHIKLVESILQNSCSDSSTITRSEIFDIFEKKSKSGIEKYRFERDVSELIRTGSIPGYKIKVGRKGGITKAESMEQITLVCSRGKYVGAVTKKQLTEFILSLKPHTD